MKKFLVLLLILPIFAAEAPKATAEVAALRAENEALKAQLTEMQVAYRWDLMVCRQSDLMQARLATIAANSKVEAQKKAETKTRDGAGNIVHP